MIGKAAVTHHARALVGAHCKEDSIISDVIDRIIVSNWNKEALPGDRQYMVISYGNRYSYSSESELPYPVK